MKRRRVATIGPLKDALRKLGVPPRLASTALKVQRSVNDCESHNLPVRTKYAEVDSLLVGYHDKAIMVSGEVDDRGPCVSLRWETYGKKRRGDNWVYVKPKTLESRKVCWIGPVKKTGKVEVQWEDWM